ncbi:hypothetical protein [Litorisediminicola beolgyonensis]|uniref:Lipoprotein n=1 Tax=Litorisediminicola beolgyonensis TaxID=1173614 RepID=A0ABW3ZN17_9RHOB
MRIWKKKKPQDQRVWLALAVLAMAAPVDAAEHASDSGTSEEAQVEDDPGMRLEDAPVQRRIALLCRFGTECYEAETCQSTDFELTVEGRAGGSDETALMAGATLGSVAGDVEALGAFAEGVLSLTGGDLDGRHLLTVTGDAARYSVHYSDGPMVISYLGACEGAE